jgi:hypothetical protein
VDEGVTALQVGDRVATADAVGAYAQLCVTGVKGFRASDAVAPTRTWAPTWLWVAGMVVIAVHILGFVGGAPGMFGGPGLFGGPGGMFGFGPHWRDHEPLTPIGQRVFSPSDLLHRA